MIASFLITFREALEAALVIGIIAAYLAKMGRKDLNKHLYMGAGAAILASILLGAVFMSIYGGLEGRAEKIFEAGASLTAVAVLTYMIFWMAQNSKRIKGEIQEKVHLSITKGQVYGITLLAFVAVFREGVETVLFLGTLAMVSPVETITGFSLGILSVLILAVLMFRGVYRLDIRKFFKYTSAILIVFAAGLTAYGVHELNEAGIIPPVIDPVWDINPPVNPDGSYPLLHEKGAIGSILKSLVGYNGNPSLTEVLAYVAYWLIVGSYVLKVYRPKSSPTAVQE
jgi:high-affinity iron transporter